MQVINGKRERGRMVRTSAKLFKCSAGKFVMYGVLVAAVMAAAGAFAAKTTTWA